MCHISLKNRIFRKKKYFDIDLEFIGLAKVAVRRIVVLEIVIFYKNVH